MMLMAVGILGIEIFQVETQGRIGVGESLKLSDYTITYRELASWDDGPKGVNFHPCSGGRLSEMEFISVNCILAETIYFDSQQT